MKTSLNFCEYVNVKRIITFKTLIFMLLSFCVIESVTAQNYTIGTGNNSTTTGEANPIDGSYESNRYQVVYTKAQLTAAGMPSGSYIDQLGFSISEDYGGGSLLGYKIRMAHTTEINAANHNYATLLEVKNAFNYNPTPTTSANFDMITLDGGFIWNGVDNLLIDICTDGPNIFSDLGGVRTIAASSVDGSICVRDDFNGSMCDWDTWEITDKIPKIRLHKATTTPSCFKPIMFTATPLITTVDLSWIPPYYGNPIDYSWEVRTSGVAGSGPTGLAASGTTASTFVTVTGLQENINYTAYVRTKCGTSNYSTWTSQNFYTSYCKPAPTSVNGLGITSVKINTVNNVSGAEPGNYGNYSNLISDVKRANQMFVEIVFQTGVPYDLVIWVDQNDDLVLDDATEQIFIYQSTSNNPDTILTYIAIPNTFPLGPHRLRIGSSGSNFPTSCYTGTFGAYEDYTINVVRCSNVVSSSNNILEAVECAEANATDVFFDPNIQTVAVPNLLLIPFNSSITFRDTTSPPVIINLDSENAYLYIPSTSSATFENVVLRDIVPYPIINPVIENFGILTLKNTNIVGTAPNTVVKINANPSSIINIIGNSYIKNQ